MTTDVFISYATVDRRFADEICLRLEAEHLKCWIAPRDMTPGQDWSKALVEAINSVSMLVVVISSQTCSSRHVPREVEQADRSGKVIIPIWTEDCELSGQLAYYLDGLHAIRGKSGQDSVDELVRAAQTTLDGLQTGAVAPVIQTKQVSDDDYVALARAICRNIREQIGEMATNEDAITIAEPVHGKQVKFIDLACNRAARKAVSQWETRHATSVHLVGEDFVEAFPVNTDLPVVCVLDSLDGTQHWLRGKNLYCTALSIFARTDAPSSPFRLRVSAIQQPDGALLIAREDFRAAYVDGRSRPILLNVSNAAEDMKSAHVCTVSRRPDHYRVLIRHLASGSPFSGLYTFGGNPALADLALGSYDAVFQPDASAAGDSQPIWDWLPGGHILLRAGGRIVALDGSPLDVVSAAESSINTGGGHYPYVAAHTMQLATAIARWLASHSQP
jgi:fructose-1,6-bisphosphatase/inositol monophosphatase family enzyme